MIVSGSQGVSTGCHCTHRHAGDVTGRRGAATGRSGDCRRAGGGAGAGRGGGGGGGTLVGVVGVSVRRCKRRYIIGVDISEGSC